MKENKYSKSKIAEKSLSKVNSHNNVLKNEYSSNNTKVLTINKSSNNLTKTNEVDNKFQVIKKPFPLIDIKKQPLAPFKRPPTHIEVI